MFMLYTRTENRKFHIIYKTTCSITGKWYIGMHSTDDLSDGYMGSGTIISRSIKKYGKDKHAIEILEYLPDRKTLALREEEILSSELRANPLCMNIRNGGTGNNPGQALKEETKEKMSVGLKATWAKRKANGEKGWVLTQEQIAKRAASNTGKKRSEETRQKMREAQALYNLTVTPEKRLSEHDNRSNAKAQRWIVETPMGKKTITNIKKFAIEKGLSVSKFYKTLLNGKSYDSYRILRKV